MAFTFVEIEEHKTRTLVLLFVTLVLLYTASIIALMWGVRLILGNERPLTMGSLLLTLCLALIGAAIHWMSSTDQLVERVLTAVLARPMDPEDVYHMRLKNIIEEVSVATGGGHQIEAYVMPTPAMNACAIADFSGRAAIAVTEGLLARLTRAQLEAVIGHEAAHVASGDSLTKSVFCGLFGLHEEALKRLSGLFSGRAGTNILRGRGGVLVVFVMVVLWVTNTAKRLCELCVSREQEYRADAVAVRLTRDPLSLAEALQMIQTHWRGVGAQGESLSTIFIVDPGTEYLSEREGLMAEWFSTHPPTHRRIEALLGMTHINVDDFEKTMALHDQRKSPQQLAPDKPAEAQPSRWFAWLDGTWKGPLTLEEVAGLESLTPEGWIRHEGEPKAMPAFQDPHVLQVLQRRYGSDGPRVQGSATECPNCHISLTRVLYEGVSFDECPACRGCYVMPDQVTRILTRQEYAFSERIKRLAETIPQVTCPIRVAREFGSLPYRRMSYRQCPKCGSAVVRKFYTTAYLVEVEQCWVCGLAWFDKDELELLQYLYEDAKAKGRRTPLEAG